MTVQVDIRDERFTRIVNTNAEVETVASGFRFLEGPVWHPHEHSLMFSDIMGNGLYRWSEQDGVSLFRANSYMANGNTYDLQGNLLTCEHATSRVTRTEKDGTYEVMASHYNGKQLNSPKISFHARYFYVGGRWRKIVAGQQEKRKNPFRLGDR
jgi:gluconolactonase